LIARINDILYLTVPPSFPTEKVCYCSFLKPFLDYIIVIDYQLTGKHLFSFPSFCMFHLMPGKPFGWLVGGSGPLLRSKGMYEQCCILKIFFGHFLHENIQNLLKKLFLLPLFFASFDRDERRPFNWLQHWRRLLSKNKCCMHFPCFWLVYLSNYFYFKN